MIYKKYKQLDWDSKHSTIDSDNDYDKDSFVTGTINNNYFEDNIQKYHGLNIDKNKSFLDIGIGGGASGVGIKSRVNKIIGVDISSKSLEISKNFYDELYLTDDINKIEPVDIAFSHLCIQHNHEEEVIRIIDDVNIKDDGIFSFQFASLNPKKTVLSELIINDINRSMLYFYSSDKMKSMINLTDKKLIEESGPFWFDDPFSFEWYIFRVVNK
tara:strand:- start:38686 stop:39327 length:642 start_codon:yes stop_codon:yes gene_type:complete